MQRKTSRGPSPMVPAAVVLLLGTLILGACSSSGETRRTNTNLLTQEEIAAAGVSNLYEAVERLRPRWLQVRSARSFGSETGIVVFQGRTYMGEPDILRTWSPTSVHSIRYLDGATASASLPVPRGMHVEGAIVLEVGPSDR